MQRVDFNERRRRICSAVAQTCPLSYDEISSLLERYKSLDMLLCILDTAAAHGDTWQGAERIVGRMLEHNTYGQYSIDKDGKLVIKGSEDNPALPIPWAMLVEPSWVAGGEVILRSEEEVAGEFLND